MTSENFTEACDTRSCTLTCATESSDNEPRNFCASLDQNFVDGTPCTGGGMCSNGRCRSEGESDDDDNFGGGGGGSGNGNSWFDNNRNLVIGLAAGLGSLVVLILACCVLSSCRSRSKKKKMAAMQPPPPVMGQYYGGGYPSYPGQAHMNQYPRGNVPLVRYA